MANDIEDPADEPPGRAKTLRAVMRPWVNRALVGVPMAAGFYQFGCDQFDWPKLPALADMSGGIMPWWGWLLIAQAGFVYALFEYVRRTRVQMFDDSALRGEMAESDAAIEALAAGVGQLERKVEASAKLAVTTQEKQGKWCDLTTQRIEAVEAAAKGARDYAKGTNHSVSESLGALEKEQRLFIQRMETWVGNLRREIRLGFKGVDRGFAAIYAREQLLDMAYELTKVGDKLTGPSRGEPLGDWKEWQAKAADWHKAVEAWARLAEKWREGTIERVILNTPPSEYKQDWGVEDYNIFPNHNAGHDYKTLCITSRNFYVERKSVDQYMLGAAFVRPSRKPVLSLADLKELEDENPPALPPPEVQDDQ